jgi:spermidine synthase
MVLWSSYFKYSLRKLFKTITPQKIYGGLAILYMAMLTPILVRKWRSRLPRIGVLTAVATTGFAEVTFQIITLLSFQIIYGYVFYKLGIILTSYMLGLIFGSWGIIRMMRRNQGDYRLFRKTQVSIVIYPMLLPLLFWVFASLKGKVSFSLGSNIIFPFLPIVAGFIGGFQFPLANKLYLRTHQRRVATSAGITYGLDLFGSCVGALLSSLILIPILGIYITCIVVALLNIISLILLLVGIKR